MKTVAPALVLAAATALTGCTDHAADNRPHVVASAYPFAFVAGQVGGPYVDVTNLTSTGVEPHDIELTPQQVAALSDADLVILEGGFQPAVDDTLQQIDGTALDVADVVALSQNAEQQPDPHVWLDPQRMIELTNAIAEQVAELVSEQADAIHDQARLLVDELAQLDDAYITGLADCDRRTFVTSHAAFGYLAERYDLTMVAIAGVDPTLEPSAAQQAENADTEEREGETTVFTEALVSPAVAESIADEAGATVATLDPIEGLSDSTTHEDYLTLMRSNLAALRTANGCR